MANLWDLMFLLSNVACINAAILKFPDATSPIDGEFNLIKIMFFYYYYLIILIIQRPFNVPMLELKLNQRPLLYIYGYVHIADIYKHLYVSI